MTIIINRDSQPITQLTIPLQQACDDYRHFIARILKPAKDDLEAKVRTNAVTLHQVFGANLIAAHSVDYLQAVRTAAGMNDTRAGLVKNFDDKFSVAGAYLRNRKMELIDAINNGLKHIRLLPERYKELGERYGQISFRSLEEHDGRVYCNLVKYRFDYCRVVLLPALSALTNWNFNNSEDVLEFAKGDFIVAMAGNTPSFDDPSDPSTAIDRMIDLCSSPCINCDEAPDDCQCSQYVFAGEHGKYEPLYTASAKELEELMNQISPSYGHT